MWIATFQASSGRWGRKTDRTHQQYLWKIVISAYQQVWKCESEESGADKWRKWGLEHGVIRRVRRGDKRRKGKQKRRRWI